MTRTRLIASAIVVATILSLLWLDYQCGTPAWLNRPGLVLGICCLVLGLMAASEILHFNSADLNRRVKPWAVYLGTVVAIAFAFVPQLDPAYPADCSIGRIGWLAFAMAAALGIAFVSQMIGYRKGDHVMNDVSRTMLVIAYVGLLFGFWAPIRGFQNNEWGLVALLSLFVTVKMSDSMAYLVGRAWGTRKLAPELSPGKTVEGLLGGLAGGCAGALLVFWVLGPWITGQPPSAHWSLIIGFAILVTGAGVMGDLAASLMKRDGGVKDSSRWLPGLGGIIDMTDSLLTAGPVVMAFWASGLLLPAAG